MRSNRKRKGERKKRNEDGTTRRQIKNIRSICG